MIYSTDNDPLCYPGTTVLRNRLGLRDPAALEQFESAMFLARAEERLPTGTLDVQHYRALHRHLFQDVYEWAGQFRTIRIGKAGNWFCFPEYIEPELKKLFANLAAERHLRSLNRVAFAERSAHYIAEINAIHPFREGNGRTQLTFLSLLIKRRGFSIDGSVLERDRVMKAMIESFHGDESPLIRMISDLIG